MTHLFGMVGLMLTHAYIGLDSSSSVGTPGPDVRVPTFSPLHIVASAYGSLGSYSTDTRSRSASTYFTLSNSWQDYYTVGFATLWLERDDAGGKYYSQQLVSARASWLFDYRTNLSVHYGYLHEGEIASFSAPSTFHFVGGGVHYWFSPTAVAGTSATLSLSESKLQSSTFRASFSFQPVEGFWVTSTATVGEAQWAPRLFVFRQSLSVSLGGESSLQASADIGRRVFHFDDELLVAYNQREIQTGYFLLKGTVKLFPHFFVVPSFEYDAFDSYNSKYGSLGLRVVF